MKKVKEYPETHMQGTISIENLDLTLANNPKVIRYGLKIQPEITNSYFQGDLGVHIADDGRVWVCINGIAFLRFSPHPDGKMQKPDVPPNDQKIIEAVNAVITKINHCDKTNCSILCEVHSFCGRK
jgi:hypothetical protein